MKRFIKNSRGDTIVEVLISLAILTLVLGGAYYTANRSYRNDRDSQEHTEALTVAQTQIEDLRVVGNSAIQSRFSSGGSFCLDNSLGTPSNWPTVNCAVKSNSTSTFSGTCPAVAPYCYNIAVSYAPLPPLTEGNALNTFTVSLTTYKINVSWSSLGGGTDQVTLYYRWDN